MHKKSLVKICHITFLFFLFFFISSSVKASSIESIIEDFEDNNLWNPVLSLGFWKLDDSYEYSSSDSKSCRGKYSMKVHFNKTKPYQMFAAYIDNTSSKRDFSRFDKLEFMVYGKAEILVKLEDTDGKQINIGSKSVQRDDRWYKLTYDFSKVDIDKKNVKNIYFFFYPGQSDIRGVVYIDDVKLVKELSDDKNTVVDVSQERDIFSVKEPQSVSIISPNSVDVDKEGNFYVVQNYASLIFKYNRMGNYRDEFCRYGKKEGELLRPVSIVFDPSNCFYVLDDKNKRIQKFSKNGKIVKSFGINGAILFKNRIRKERFAKIVDFTVDSKGDIYVLEKKDKIIYVFSNNGEPLLSMKAPFVNPVKMRFWEDRLYVLDAGKNSVEVFSTSGRFIFSEKIKDSSDKEYSPIDIAFDKNNKMFFVIAKNYSKILVLNEKLHYVKESNYFSLSTPVSLTVKSFDRGSVVFVCDVNNMKVYFAPVDNVLAIT